MRLRRLFWIGAAGLLGLAALISIVAILRGEFTETDGKTLTTLAAAFLAGSVSLAGLALIERRELVPLARTVTAGGIAGFAVLTWQIWAELTSERWPLDTVTLLLAGLMITTSRLLSRDPKGLYWTSAALTTITAVTYVWAIHAGLPGDNRGKTLATLGILTVLAWFLVPVLGRIRTNGGETERVVGRGPGTIEVELAEGETLVVRTG